MHESAARALRRSIELHEAHVLMFNDLTAWDRYVAQCKVCGSLVRAMDWSRTCSGTKKKHCGCRDGNAGGRKLGVNRLHCPQGVKSKEAKRAFRVMAMPGYKAVKHQAHVNAYVLHKRAEAKTKRDLMVSRKTLTRDELRKQWRKTTERLSDGYVSRRLKKGQPLLKGVKMPQELIDLERVRLMIVREVRLKDDR
jgi:hypothetical protein